MHGPTKCVVETPHVYHIQFGGEFINLRELSEVSNVDHGSLSRILSGRTANPRTNTLQRIAKGLGMSMEDVLEAIARRKAIALALSA